MSSSMRNGYVGLKLMAVILAGGKSTRFGQGDKLLAKLGNKPVIAYAISTFDLSNFFDELIVVVNADGINAYKAVIEQCSVCTHTKIVPGGSTRQESVYQGLLSITTPPDVIVIHDGARPFVSQECIKRTIDAAIEYGASTAGVHPKDIIKIDQGNVFVASSIEKRSAWLAQTPQAFKWSSLMGAHQLSKGKLIHCEDDASLLEQSGEKVRIVQGEDSNIKITTPFDLALAEFLLNRLNGL